MSEIPFERKIGFLGALSIGAGAVLGPGEYILSGLVAAKVGPAAVFSFMIAGVILLFTALSFAELGPMFPRAGGPYYFVKKGMGSYLGFLEGWTSWLSVVGATAFYTIGAAHFITELFIPWFPVGLLVLIITGLFVFINIVGVRFTTVVEILLFIGSLIPIIWFVGVGSFQINPEFHTPLFVTGWDTVLYTAGLITVNFVGFELISASAGEIKNPGRNVPAATILSLLIMVILVAGVIWISTGVVHFSSMSGSEVPIAIAARSVAGNFGFVAISIGGILACLTGINASILAASRFLFTLSFEAPLPDAISKIHKELGTPHYSVLITGILIGAMSYLGTMEITAALSAAAILPAFVLVNITLIMLRRKKPSLDRPFKVWGSPIVPLIGAITCILLYIQLKSSTILYGALVISGGTGLFFGLKKLGLSKREEA